MYRERGVDFGRSQNDFWKLSRNTIKSTIP